MVSTSFSVLPRLGWVLAEVGGESVNIFLYFIAVLIVIGCLGARLTANNWLMWLAVVTVLLVLGKFMEIKL